MSRRANQAGRDLIMRYESLQLAAYRDTGGVLSIGWGHTTPPIPDRITREQAETYLAEDLREAEEAVERLVQARLCDNEFAALVALTYNVGQGELAKSRLRQKLNDGDRAGAAAEFLIGWDTDDGVEQKGLVHRRAAEQQLFLTPDCAHCHP